MRWPVILGLGAVSLAVVLGLMSGPEDHRPEAWTISNITSADLDNAWRQAATFVVEPVGHVQAGITPHHALVGSLIAAWAHPLGSQPDPGTIVILGPDHHNAGAGYVTTATTDWLTPDGRVMVDRPFINAVVGAGNAVVDPQLIRQEHGVSTVIPYLHRMWPSAKIATFAVKGDLRPDRLARLANQLDHLLGPNDIVLASVDFSHYRPTIDALNEDRESLAVIASGDATAALTIPVDSPPAISLLLRYQKNRGLTYQQLVHTSSGVVTGQFDAQSTTSYLNAYFVALERS